MIWKRPQKLLLRQQKTAVDEDKIRNWEYVLENLYPIPQDDDSIVETEYNQHPYRCHPAVIFAVHPSGCVEPGNPLWGKAKKTYEIITRLFGFNYEDRKVAIAWF